MMIRMMRRIRVGMDLKINRLQNSNLSLILTFESVAGSYWNLIN